MTKPLTIQIDEAAAEQLARIANDLGETPEQTAQRLLAAGIESIEANVMFARRTKNFDRAAALKWLRDLAARTPHEPDADDCVPDGYTPSR